MRPRSARHVAGVEFGEAVGEPLVAVAGQQPPGQVASSWTCSRAKQVDDLGGLGKMRAGEVPDPRGAVAQDGELTDVPGAARRASAAIRIPLRRSREGGQVRGRTGIADRVSLYSSRSG